MASSSCEPKLKAEAIAVVESTGGGETSENVMDHHNLLIYRGLKKAKKERGCTAKERISKMPPCVAGKRSSIYRGVTRHRWTGRYEAHLWDKSTWNQNQNKKGKQGTVSDYSRDLEEMQNISREDYLASLRRKSSGFSRGISKYRGLSRPSQNSRWETSFGQIGMPDYLSSIRYGEGTTTDCEYAGGFCIERKIDLTSYFKWWGPNKTRRSDSLTKSFDESKCSGSEDIGSELKALERGLLPTEPYKMPSLGLSHGGGSTVSAMSILSRSPAYQSLKENVLKEQDENTFNNENKSNDEMGYCKPIQKSGDAIGGSERLGVALNMNWLPFQRTSCPLTPFLSAPILANYTPGNPIADPVLWTSLVSVPPGGLSLPAEVTKTETSSTYICFHQDER
ncbi:hypothetical protein IFM89_017729 [Coptis chinensis]|uniref:AP2/ERF domain-containing protein n=1 Tax=Coptis chinensis TaxID=261450 RepID=A0A835LJ08_9MAGN|nr:hypothetical protein IFM89_017729 [Coptis chinensis]